MEKTRLEKWNEEIKNMKYEMLNFANTHNQKKSLPGSFWDRYKFDFGVTGFLLFMGLLLLFTGYGIFSRMVLFIAGIKILFYVKDIIVWIYGKVKLYYKIKKNVKMIQDNLGAIINKNK